MLVGVEIKGHGNRRLDVRQLRCKCCFQDMVNHARSHRTILSGGGIVRHGGRRAEDERTEVEFG